MGLTLASAALPLGMTYVGKLIVDAVMAAQAATDMATRDAARGEAVYWLLVEFVLVGGLMVVERGLLLARQLLEKVLGTEINVLIMEKAMQMELADFEDAGFYDKLVRARREASTRPLSLVHGTFQVVRSGLTLAGCATLLMHFNPWTVLGLLVAVVPAFIAEVNFSAATFRLRRRRAPEARQIAYLEWIISSDNHAKEMKLFSLGPLLVARYKQKAKAFYEEDRRLALVHSFWGSALTLLGLAAFYGSYLAVILATALGRLTLGEMTFCVAAFRQGQQSFQSVLNAVNGMYQDNLYMSNLFEFLLMPVRFRRSGAVQTARREHGIRFEGVGFRYPGVATWALRDISLFVPAGESIALVGQNGAGKTTFIRLLTGLYDPDEGAVLLDGRDVRGWDPADLRRRMGVIFQDFNQYQFLLRENIGVGSIDHLGDDSRIERAVLRSGADSFVAGLNRGLDTQLGRMFEGGVNLSGGQWQKVALARAFMREEADIFVLDEPTAALDVESEHAIFQRFAAVAKGKTTILISHRFRTVRKAGRIIVIEGGRIVEQGSHQKLMNDRGRYAAMFALQADGYH
ncbi:MAG TPA: ABC transporter ATP-binding protein [Opitutaceae bacterium]|nr:ABC transporter ATP-binding protein [Opitutaceae bacterium]